MAKWINVLTGLVVPATEVRELAAGSGLFVHEATKVVNTFTSDPVADPLSPPPGATFGRVYTLRPDTTTRVVDGYAIKLGDDETYDPAVHTIQAQVLAAQAALRARGAGR